MNTSPRVFPETGDNADGSFAGSRLRSRRTQALLTHERLARLTGVHATTIRDIENGRISRPSAETIRLLFETLETEDRTVLAPRTGPRSPSLPAGTTGFTGRSTELSIMDGILETTAPAKANSRTIIISGTAGIGKTALALHWAHRVADRFPDGLISIDLRGYDEHHPVGPDEALAVFLRELGITPGVFPCGRAERAGLYRMLVRRRRMLIVLDNARDAEHVRDLMPGATPSLVLVTSRNTLSNLAADAHRIELDRLSPADAHTLLRVHAGERVDEEAAAAAALAGQCTGLPLALRIAARLAGQWPRRRLADLAVELADERTRLHLLDTGDPHGRTSAVFSWSYRHLPAQAARLFRLWGAQPGRELGFAAIAALSGSAPATTRHAVDVLLRAHLLRETGPHRYEMHDLLAIYAGELARTVDRDEELDEAFTRLLEHYLDKTAAAVRLLHPQEWPAGPGNALSDRAEAIAWLDTERANLVAAALYAADHRRPSQAVRMSNLLFRYLDIGSHHAESRRLHATALRVASRAELGDVLAHHGVVLWRAGRYREMLGQYRHALALHRESGDRWAEANAIGNIGAVHWRLGATDDALACYEFAHAVFTEVGDQCRRAYSVGHIGIVHIATGHYAEAHRKLTAAIASLRELGDTYGEAGLLDGLGLACNGLGRYDEALGHFTRALRLARELGDRQCAAEVLNSLGITIRETGSPDRALPCHRAALAHATEIGDRFERARAHEGIAECHHRLGDVPTARGQLRLALELHNQLGTPQARRIGTRLRAMA